MLEGLPLPFTLTWTEGTVRTNDQNALVHVWFADVAKQTGDSFIRVKGLCNLIYGVPICSRDPQWRYVWDRTGPNLPYEKRIRFCASGILQFTSRMKVKELVDYMDAMHAEYSGQGVTLSLPEDVKQ